ncbi:MAG: hypothetical protein ACXVZH_10210 [Terriglobales bacterium]
MNEQPGSWLALVAFCAVTTLSVALGFGILFAGGSAAFAVVQPSHASDEIQPDTAGLSQASDYEDVEAEASRSSQLRQVDEGGASDKIFAGLITDSHCGARHSMKSGKSSAECARSCVRNGAHYVLVDGEKNHSLEGGSPQLEELAGERVEVVGMLEGDTIKVKSVVSR